MTTTYRNTLHWRLATVYGGLEDWSHREQTFNVCAYARRVFAGMLAVALIIAVGGICAWGVGDMLAWLAVISQGAYIKPDQPAAIAATAIIAAASLGIIFGALILWVEHREKQREAVFQAAQAGLPIKPKQPSIFALWYKGIKEKTCFAFTVEKDAKLCDEET